MTIDYPVTFVFAEDLSGWQDVVNADLPALPDSEPARYPHAAHALTIQTYIHLKRRGNNVRLDNRFPNDGVCVVYYTHASLRMMPYNSYIVAFPGDRSWVDIAHHWIMMNPGAAKDGPNRHFIPQWPQTGLIPRDPSRGERMETVGYLGAEGHLYPEFRTESFRRELAALGLRLVTKGEDCWHDYSDVDVVLAVRHLPAFMWKGKSACKLVNAWHAGCPALLSPEPGYRMQRRSELDYLEVSTPEEALAALRSLKSNPDRYRQMVENGKKRAQEFSIDAISEQWEQLLTGPVRAGFERWRAGIPGVRQLSRAMRFGVCAARQRFNRWSFERSVRDSGIAPKSA